MHFERKHVAGEKERLYKGNSQLWYRCDGREEVIHHREVLCRRRRGRLYCSCSNWGGFLFRDGGNEPVCEHDVSIPVKEIERSSVYGSRHQRHRALGAACERLSHSAKNGVCWRRTIPPSADFKQRTTTARFSTIAPRKQGMVPPLNTSLAVEEPRHMVTGRFGLK